MMAKGKGEQGGEPPKARSLLERALATIDRELLKISGLSEKGEVMPLAPEDMNALLSITRTLVQVDKNEKDYPEDEKDETDEMSYEELRAAARAVIEKEGGKR